MDDDTTQETTSTPQAEESDAADRTQEEPPDPSTATEHGTPPYGEVLAANGYPDVLVLSSEAAKRLDERHVRIVEHLRAHEPGSPDELADRVDIPAGDVSGLLDDLAELGIVTAVEEGRRSVPRLAREHVVVALA